MHRSRASAGSFPPSREGSIMATCKPECRVTITIYPDRSTSISSMDKAPVPSVCVMGRSHRSSPK
eukprot:scaffold22361_cov184-Amphora_coffeaeformis.AAC.2